MHVYMCAKMSCIFKQVIMYLKVKHDLLQYVQYVKNVSKPHEVLCTHAHTAGLRGSLCVSTSPSFGFL